MCCGNRTLLIHSISESRRTTIDAAQASLLITFYATALVSHPLILFRRKFHSVVKTLKFRQALRLRGKMQSHLPNAGYRNRAALAGKRSLYLGAARESRPVSAVWKGP